jgi:hypothetical protein
VHCLRVGFYTVVAQAVNISLVARFSTRPLCITSTRCWQYLAMLLVCRLSVVCVCFVRGFPCFRECFSRLLLLA